MHDVSIEVSKLPPPSVSLLIFYIKYFNILCLKVSAISIFKYGEKDKIIYKKILYIIIHGIPLSFSFLKT